MTTNRPTIAPAAHKPILIACAWCARTKVGSQWKQPAEPTPGTAISHGICPTCYAIQLAKVPRSYARG